jgi:peptidoglycan/LPS O-acetylase OafA/YrhL
MEKKHYDAIDGLRTIACIGIVMMHISANNSYDISGFIYDRVIASFTNFVYLFMVISAFGMCCGYYERMLNNQISLETFYANRYKKVLPFFAILVLIDVVMTHSKAALIEGFADITLLFGLFPNNIEVIGVGWFLGLIFAFYIIFPFYCVLIKNKRRAWFMFTFSVLLNYILLSYFGIGRHNIGYCLPYLIMGGIIYLYREELEQFSKKFWWLMLIGIIVCATLYYTVGANTITLLLVSAAFLIYALGNSGGYCRTGLQSFSVLSVWKYISPIWSYSEDLKSYI